MVKKPKISSLFLVSSIPFWNQLCVYTYALLRRKMYDVFDSLFNQFQIVVAKYHRTLSASELTEFSEICYSHLEYAMAYSVNKSIMIKILIRMTGLLPIKKKNIDLSNGRMIKIALAFLENAKEDYNNILREISTQEWPLFRDGLVLYLSFEMLNQANDTINLVRSIPDEEWKKDLAIVLLQRLAELKKPILGRNWTDLFSLVDPISITLDHFQLIDSMQMYVTILARILEVESNSTMIHSQLSGYFDQMIHGEYLPGKIKRIYYKLFYFLL